MASGLRTSIWAVLLFSAGTSWADGYHSRYFQEHSDFKWERIQERLKGKTSNKIRQQIIRELIIILEFFGGYESQPAPDSPQWTHTDKGRTFARRNTIELLDRLGEHALPTVWEAYLYEIRSDTPQRRNDRAGLDKALAARDSIWSALLKEAQKVPEARGALSRMAQRMLSRDGRNLLDPSRDLKESKYKKAKELALKYRLAHEKTLPLLKLFHKRYVRHRSEAMKDLTPSKDFRTDLEAVFLRMGNRALPLLEIQSRHRNRRVAGAVKQILDVIRLKLAKQKNRGEPLDPEDPAFEIVIGPRVEKEPDPVKRSPERLERNGWYSIRLGPVLALDE